ncbi:MAG: hypothetical protein HY738_16525 [Bacteroidia bacterium]|nr:hypothetical protein [Bacteroidia bacterium]
MERYLEQLLADIAFATQNVRLPFVEQEEVSLFDWVSEEEEERTAPTRQLEEWTGISKVQLPPPEMLSDEQVNRLLNALIKMLDAYNWMFVLQIDVPERIQYATIRDNFDQEAKVKRWHMGFFELCRPGTEHGKCSLGEYCQCRFFKELFAGFSDEELSPEEERAMELDCEITHLKRKHGDDWMKYYPYHLDPDYDDENGNPYDYGFGYECEDDDDDDDNWWRR